MELREYNIVGVTPLLMHSNRGLNPFDPLTKEIKTISTRRNKTDDDLLKLSELEWHAGLYHDDQIGPYLQGIAIDRSLRDAAKQERKGKDVERGLSCMELKLPLQYDGPRDRHELFSSPAHVDMRAVKVSGRGIMRCRPIFPNWSAKVPLAYDPQIFNPEQIDRLFARAGQIAGLCDYRPRYGKYIAEPIA